MARPQAKTTTEIRQEAAGELKVRRGARKSLLEFCHFTLPRYQANWHLEFLCKELENVMHGKTKRLMVFMPPRHGKSETISVRFPAFYLGNKPQNQVIACSYSGSLAHNFSNSCRGVMQGPAYQRLWPVKFDTDSTTHWKLAGKENERNSYIAAGVGGGISGEGANLLIIDDPIKNAEEADSFVIREKQWDWYRTTARTRLQPGGAIVLVLTRWHEDDLAGRLLRQMKADKDADQWKVILLPAMNTDGLGAIPKAIGTYSALWGENYPHDELLRIKSTVGSRTWSALYQQRPTSGMGKIWKREWFRYYKIADLPKHFDTQLWSWDMTFKETKDSDFVVGQLWGFLGSRKFLLRQVREKMDFPKTCDKVYSTAKETPQAYFKLIEEKANGPAVIQALKNVIEGIKPIPKTAGKEACWQASTPAFESGDVWLPDPNEQPWVHDFVDELCGVPEGALHDDQADAAAQAINFMNVSTKCTVMEFRV
jgi:predicted phage terminase large subunit-like protein